MKFASLMCFALLAVATSAYQLGAAPRLVARRRGALVVLQEQPVPDAAMDRAAAASKAREEAVAAVAKADALERAMAEDMMDAAESAAAPEAAARPEAAAVAAAQPAAAPPVEASSYLSREKAKYGLSDAGASDDDAVRHRGL